MLRNATISRAFNFGNKLHAREIISIIAQVIKLKLIKINLLDFIQVFIISYYFNYQIKFISIMNLIWLLIILK